MTANEREVRRVRSWPLGLLLGGLCFVVYLTNLRPMGAIDTMAARWLPFSVVRELDLDLDEFPWLQREDWGRAVMHGANGHALSGYPVATPIAIAPLALPAVAWLRSRQIEDDDVRVRLVAIVVERIGAALIAAASTTLVFLAAGALTRRPVAAGVALAYGLASGTWAISSQALWQHGLAELCLSGLSLCLLRPGGRRRHAVAGGFAAIGVAARPTMVIFALLGLCYVWRERRDQLAVFLVLPFVVAGLLLAYNLGQAGALAGGYAGMGVAFGWPTPTSLFGLLLSPNRGLFVYTPAAALALIALAQRRVPATWLWYLFAGMAAHLLVFACFRDWWAGNVYGPRYLVDILPALALCAVPVVDQLWRRPAGRATLLALTLWGVAVQAIGVYTDDGSWSVTPYTITSKPERAWDWSDLQIVRAARAGWHGGELAPLLWQMMTDPRPARLRELPPEALAGAITVAAEPPLRARAGGRLPLELRVANHGASAWPSFSDYGRLQVGVLARWWRGGTPREDVGQLIPLPRNVGPDEAEAVAAQLEAPPQAGPHELELMVVQEIDLTHGVFGGASLRIPVVVE